MEKPAAGAFGLFCILAILSAVLTNQNDPEIFKFQAKIEQTSTPPVEQARLETLTNSEYREKYAKNIIEFRLDDTEKMKSLNTTITAIPREFGFSAKEGNNIFPEFYYPDCRESVSDKDAYASLDYKSN
jgi:hypothetical protein